ncbi:MAG: alpha/beta hydrolase [Planctomycetota bacterium]
MYTRVVAVAVLAIALACSAQDSPATDDTPAYSVRGVEALGAPVVAMLSGGPGFRGNLMTGLGEAIGETRRVVLIDQRGTGASAAMELSAEAMTIEGAVADLERVRESVGAERWSLAGHSWGGLLAMAYAAEHPDRVDSLVLVAPAGIDASFWGAYQQNIMAAMPVDDMAALRSLRPKDESPEAMHEVMREANRLYARATVASDEAAATLREEWMNAEEFFPAATMAMQPSLMSFDLRDDLAEFDRPALVITGESDPIGVETVERIRDTLGGAELVLLEDCGHWPMIEQPKQLSERVTAFLNERE